MWAVVNSKSSSWNIVERLCFPAPKPSYNIKSFPDELILVPRADGEKVHMLAVEYPGYGICPGHCDEDGIMANANAALNFAMDTLHWPCDGIKLLGRSLGTGPAVALAAQYDVAGVILVTPFLSIREIFKAQVGYLADFIADRFPNYKLAGKIESPTLIIHGQQDTLIPITHSKRIYEAVPAKKMMVCPAAMAHNTSLLANVGAFVLPMTQFFSLPDYTFEDIEVPEWVFPDSNMEEVEPAAASKDDAKAWVCGPSLATNKWFLDKLTTPRGQAAGSGPQGEGTSAAAQWAAKAGSGAGTPGTKVPPLKLPTANPEAWNGSSAQSSNHGPKVTPKLTQPLKESPRGHWVSGGPGRGELDHEPSTLKVSRNYEFRSLSPTPRERHPDDHEVQPRIDSREQRQCSSEVVVPTDDTGKEVPGSRVVFSTEMLHAIKNGIDWLVDTESDVDMLGRRREASGSPQPSARLSARRGKPELRESVVQRLSGSESTEMEARAVSSSPGSCLPGCSDSSLAGKEAATERKPFGPKTEVTVKASDSTTASTAASTAPSMAPAAAPPSNSSLRPDSSLEDPGDSESQAAAPPSASSLRPPVTQIAR